MKQFIAILAAALIGGTATYVLTRDVPPPREEREANDSHLASLAELRRENQSLKARRNNPEVITVQVPAEAKTDPHPDAAHYLDQLQALQATDGRTKRRAVHYFESLVDLGETSLPPIEEFLAASQDLEFNLPPEPRPEPRNEDEARRRKYREGEAGRYFRPFPKPDNSFPPTLRLGLLETIAHLGGDSGVTHLAALSGAPALALMGPPLGGSTDPARWGPIGARPAWVYWDQVDEGAEILIGLMGLGG